MPTTSSHLLPYPEASDPADVPADIAALAEAVDTKLDTIAPAQITGPTSGQLLIANSSGVVTGTAVSGDVVISNTGDAQIQAGAVGTNELGNSAVTTAKVDSGAITADKIGTNAVTSTELRDDASTDSNRAVTTNHLRNSAVTTDKLNNVSVTSAKIADSAVTSAKIADGTIANADVSNSAAIAESKLSLASDAAAGTASRRTLGTGSTQACAGNDSRLSNARTPTGSAGGDLAGTFPNPTIAASATANATFSNGVSGGTLTARKYPGGLVVLQGTTGTLSGNTALSPQVVYATLPAGYRPTAQLAVATRNHDHVQIGTDGTIRGIGTVNTLSFSLDGIAFHAA